MVPNVFQMAPRRLVCHQRPLPNRALGCVSNNYADGQWRIVCDSRRNGLNEPGDFTFATRDAAAKAERELVRIEAQGIQAKLASTQPPPANYLRYGRGCRRCLIRGLRIFANLGGHADDTGMA